MGCYWGDAIRQGSHLHYRVLRLNHPSAAQWAASKGRQVMLVACTAARNATVMDFPDLRACGSAARRS